MSKFKLPFWKKRSPSSFDKVEAEKKKPVSVLGLRRLKEKKPKKITRKKIITFLSILCLVFLIYGIFLAIKKKPFTIQKVDFKSADLSCVSNEQIKNFLNSAGYNLFSLNEAKLKEQLGNKFSCIDSVTIRKKFPGGLEITVSEGQSAAVIKVFPQRPLDLKIADATSSTTAAVLTDNAAKVAPAGSFVVNRQGVVIKTDDGQNSLQVIDYYNGGEELKVGSRLPAGLIDKSLNLIYGLNQQGLTVKSAKIINAGLYLSINSNFSSAEIESIFSLEKDTDRQLAALQLILRQATIDSKAVQRADLRFDKAVVVYSVPGR